MHLLSTLLLLLALMSSRLNLQGHELITSFEPVRFGSIDNDCRKKPAKPSSEWVCAASHKLIWFRSKEEFACEELMMMGRLKQVDKSLCKEQDKTARAPPHAGPFNKACKKKCSMHFREEKQYCALRGEPVTPRKIELKDNEYVTGKFAWYANECEMICDGKRENRVVVKMHREFCLELEEKPTTPEVVPEKKKLK